MSFLRRYALWIVLATVACAVGRLGSLPTNLFNSPRPPQSMSRRASFPALRRWRLIWQTEAAGCDLGNCLVQRGFDIRPEPQPAVTHERHE